MDIGGVANMAVMIESLTGILLFAILIVPLTLKNPFASVGDYPPAIREKCMELGLIEKENNASPGQISSERGLPCLLLCSS